MQPPLLHLVLFPKDAHVADSRLNELFRCAREQDLPVMHDDDLVTYRLHIFNDVRREQHQTVFCRAGEQVAEVNPLFRVQADRGFVENQEGRIAQKRLGNANPLALAAR